MGRYKDELPLRSEVYNFIKRNYIPSRLDKSQMIKDFPNYVELIIDGYMESLSAFGYAYISPYESVRGTFIKFGLDLMPINESEPIEKMYHSW